MSSRSAVLKCNSVNYDASDGRILSRNCLLKHFERKERMKDIGEGKAKNKT